MSHHRSYDLPEERRQQLSAEGLTSYRPDQRWLERMSKLRGTLVQFESDLHDMSREPTLDPATCALTALTERRFDEDQLSRLRRRLPESVRRVVASRFDQACQLQWKLDEALASQLGLDGYGQDLWFDVLDGTSLSGNEKFKWNHFYKPLFTSRADVSEALDSLPQSRAGGVDKRTQMDRYSRFLGKSWGNGEPQSSQARMKSHTELVRKHWEASKQADRDEVDRQSPQPRMWYLAVFSQALNDPADQETAWKLSNDYYRLSKAPPHMRSASDVLTSGGYIPRNEDVTLGYVERGAGSVRIYSQLGQDDDETRHKALTLLFAYNSLPMDDGRLAILNSTLHQTLASIKHDDDWAARRVGKRPDKEPDTHVATFLSSLPRNYEDLGQTRGSETASATFVDQEEGIGMTHTVQASCCSQDSSAGSGEAEPTFSLLNLPTTEGETDRSRSGQFKAAELKEVSFGEDLHGTDEVAEAALCERTSELVSLALDDMRGTRAA